ncbi:MAG: hypothetical protein LBP36_03435 [Oscillospiraceae bacterium]|nr:hypothetical protein [Oscillospiraceae bacterium]
MKGKEVDDNIIGDVSGGLPNPETIWGVDYCQLESLVDKTRRFVESGKSKKRVGWYCSVSELVKVWLIKNKDSDIYRENKSKIDQWLEEG